MKKLNLIYGIIFLIMVAACSDKDNLTDETNSSLTRTTFAYTADADDVSVLIFGKGNEGFTYLRTLSSGWVNNRISTNLELGEYKFLFCLVPGTETTFTPTSLDNSIGMEDIRIHAKTDNEPLRQGYVLPVEEIWMPETEALADTPYIIEGNELISNTLKRAVSQVEVILKRAEIGQNNEITPVPYGEGSNIMNDIKSIVLDIEGVGEYIDYKGSHGLSRTYYYTQTATDFTNEGFAHFEGPFVFPTETTDPANVKITIQPTDSTKDPMSTTVSGKLERNKKLIITLWISSPDEPIVSVIDITVDTEEISLSTDGDKGIWE